MFEKADNFSPTRLKTYTSCQYKYNLKYNLKEEVSDVVPPFVYDIGTCVHNLGELVTLADENVENVNLEKKIYLEMKKLKLDFSYMGTIKDQYINLRKFILTYLKDPQIKQIKREGRVNPHFYDKIYLYGKADLKVYYKDGSGLIIDYKTSKDEEDHSLQLGIYAYSMAKEDKLDSSKIRAGIYYTKTDHFVEEKYDKKKIREVLTVADEIINRIKTDKTHEKKPNEYCKYCEYRTKCKPECIG